MYVGECSEHGRPIGRSTQLAPSIHLGFRVRVRALIGRSTKLAPPPTDFGEGKERERGGERERISGCVSVCPWIYIYMYMYIYICRWLVVC